MSSAKLTVEQLEKQYKLACDVIAQCGETLGGGGIQSMTGMTLTKANKIVREYKKTNPKTG